jgi:hypothetical protein
MLQPNLHTRDEQSQDLLTIGRMKYLLLKAIDILAEEKLIDHTRLMKDYLRMSNDEINELENKED